MLPLCAHVLATRAALRSDAGDVAVAHGLALRLAMTDLEAEIRELGL